MMLSQNTATAASAIPFLPSSEPRRQLDLCLVTILRVLYWSEYISQDIYDKLLLSGEDSNKQPYLEARLGAKALVTGRIGGGANSKVYTLATLQLKGCLKDAVYIYSLGQHPKSSKRLVDNAATTIIESLASIVEFDGLETTTDPSPRSSLMMSMYNRDKAVYVQRMLKEQTLPACEDFLSVLFDDDNQARRRCELYVYENYAEEMPLGRRKEVMARLLLQNDV